MQLHIGWKHFCDMQCCSRAPSEKETTEKFVHNITARIEKECNDE